MVKQLFVIVILLSSLIQAEVSSTIDRNPVRVNETFELTLNMETAPVSRPPLEGLPEQLEIVRSTNFYQRSSINGQTEVQAGWRFIIKATEEGKFTIPSFNIDGQDTNELSIEVLPPVSSTAVGDQKDAIKLTAEVDHEEVYVQQQILYTIRLYRAVQAQYASLTEPELEGAILERLGDDRQFETEIGGVRYIVLERQYVIFPQQSGLQTIKPVTFTAEVSDGARRYSTLGRLRSRTTAVSLSTDPIEIDVKGRPTGVFDWWLPATKVELNEEWLPKPLEYRVGTPVTWSYSVKAEGLTATQLPDLLPEEISGLKFYPDNAKSDSESTAEGITGIRTQKLAVIPTRAGSLTIPELKLNWWNVNTNKAEVISLPSRTINVLPSLDGDSGTEVVEDISDIKTEEPIIDIETTTNTNETTVNTDTESLEKVAESHIWKLIAVISLLLWIISALFLALRNKHGVKENKEASVKQPELPVVSLNEIRQACRSNSAIKTKDKILAWCKANKELTPTILSLGELAKRVDSEALKSELRELEISLYSHSAKDKWQGKKLAALLDELNDLSVKKIAGTKKQLPPLHLTD